MSRTEPPEPTGSPETDPTEPRLGMFLNRELLLDVVAPIVVYQLLVHVADMDRVPALVLSGAFPAVNVVRRLVRDHRVDPIGVIVLVGIVVGAAVSFISGSEKLTLLRESFLTAVIGLVFLGSTVVGKPLIFLIVRSFTARASEEGLEEWDQLWLESPEFRRVMRQMTLFWGIAFLLEFGLKVVMVETLSTDVVQATSGPIILGVTAILIVVTIRWGRRVRERREAAP